MWSTTQNFLSFTTICDFKKTICDCKKTICDLKHTIFDSYFQKTICGFILISQTWSLAYQFDQIQKMIKTKLTKNDQKY